MSHYPDPDVECGSFRVLPRTDGLYVVIDTRRQPGARTVGKPFKKLKDAIAHAKRWHEEGYG